MSTERSDRTVLRRHPFLFGVAAIVGAVVFFMPKSSEHKELDSSAEESSQTSQEPPEETSKERIRSSFESDRADFQRRLPTLEEPMPNLRWFPQVAAQGDFGHQTDSLLVTPYGTCVELNGNSTGYALVTMHTNPYMPSIPSTILGTFANKADAARSAEKYCHEWYAAEAGKAQIAAKIDHMWFKPDMEGPPGAPAEIVKPVPETDVTTSTGSVGQAPPPVSPAMPPAAPQEQFRWQLQPNGDEVLAGASGPCATLALSSTHDLNKVHVNFSDGSSKIYPVDQTADAMQAANDYCHANH
jgi:hypothetical protein